MSLQGAPCLCPISVHSLMPSASARHSKHTPLLAYGAMEGILDVVAVPTQAVAATRKQLHAPSELYAKKHFIRRSGCL